MESVSFNLKTITNEEVESELKSIGFDNSYLNIAKNKYQYLNIKIFSLTLPQANILKQTALTIGADCAVHKDILTAKTYATDCILGGSISQIKKIAQKIITQPFSMDKLAIEIENLLDLYTPFSLFSFKD